MKKTAKTIKLLLLITAAVCCMTHTSEVGRGVSGAVERCLATVIPSLYGMMIVSALIVRSGAASAAGRLTGRAGRLLFGMSGEEFPVFLFSMTAGYPVGAKMLTAMYSEGRLDKHRGELLCGVCYGAGPAFVSGCIASELYRSSTALYVIIISTLGGNLLTALALSVKLRKTAVMNTVKSCHFSLRGEMLTECITSAGASMAQVCLMITAFGGLGEIFRIIGGEVFVKGKYRGFLGAFWDITAIQGLPAGDYRLLPWLSALVSLGGVCVIFQIGAIVSGRFSLMPFVVLRAAASILSFGICRLIMPLMLREETLAVSALKTSAHSAPSPVPSVMLILMTFALIKRAQEGKS